MATRKTWDVAVVGGGIFGLSCAWACARRGLRVGLVERAEIASGASGGIVGALSPHTPDRWNPKKQFQFEALLAAETHWQAVEQVSGQDSGYARVGRLLPLVTAHARALAEDRAAGARAFWGGSAEWTVWTDGMAADWLDQRAAPFGIVRETLSARIAPRRACAALARALRELGAEIAEGWEMTDFSDGGIDGPDGTIAAKAVILACGVEGFARISPKAGQGEKGQAALLRPEDPAEGLPMIFHDGIYVVPQADGTVAVGSTSERDWRVDGPDRMLDRVLERAAVFCPALRDAEVIERWAGIRPRPRMRDPMLGPLPGHARVFVANGAFKIGFGIAHKVGEVLADLVEGRDPEIPKSFSLGHHLDTPI